MKRITHFLAKLAFKLAYKLGGQKPGLTPTLTSTDVYLVLVAPRPENTNQPNGLVIANGTVPQLAELFYNVARHDPRFYYAMNTATNQCRQYREEQEQDNRFLARCIQLIHQTRN